MEKKVKKIVIAMLIFLLTWSLFYLTESNIYAGGWYCQGWYPVECVYQQCNEWYCMTGGGACCTKNCGGPGCITK